MTNTELLEAKIKESGKKKAHLAAKCSMTPTTFGKYLQGNKEFRASHIAILCAELNIKDSAEMKAIFFAKAGA